jgi:DNA polymerase III subunit epsilon
MQESTATIPRRDPTGLVRSREYVAFDFETTGLRAETDRVVEIGAVRFEAGGRELARFESLVNPERPMSPGAQAVHGISDLDLVGAPTAREILPGFLDFLGDPVETTLLAHNASFDARFLGSELARLGRKPPGHAVNDTLALARARLPDLRNHRLDTLTRVLNLDNGGMHRALADSLRVKGLWLALRGDEGPTQGVIPYPIFDAGSPMPDAPFGWQALANAIRVGSRVRMEYEGGTRGREPREITPRSFTQLGGVSYVVAVCHLDGLEKKFRLDRVRWYEVIS